MSSIGRIASLRWWLMSSLHPSWHSYPRSSGESRKLAYANSPCPSCYGGAGVIAYLLKAGGVVLVCEDCEAVFDSVETLAASQQADGFSWNEVSRPATLADASRLGLVAEDLFWIS